MIEGAVLLHEATKRRPVDYFVLGVPAYRLRFHALASAPTIERFYRVIRQVLAIAEESTAPFTGAIECDETMFGGYRKGKRGWGAAGGNQRRPARPQVEVYISNCLFRRMSMGYFSLGMGFPLPCGRIPPPRRCFLQRPNRAVAYEVKF